LFYYRLKRFFCQVLAVLLVALGLIAVRCVHATRLNAVEGERAYYLQSPSSNALVTASLDFADIFLVKGESVRFSFQGDGATVAKELIKSYRAQVLFEEEACGTHSYYCYAPTLGEGVRVNGVIVNLHIALRDGACAVGTPLIFGGF